LEVFLCCVFTVLQKVFVTTLGRVAFHASTVQALVRPTCFNETVCL